MIVAPQPYDVVVRFFEGYCVVEADRLKNRVDFVVTVLALAENAQAPIDFRERWNCEW